MRGRKRESKEGRAGQQGEGQKGMQSRGKGEGGGKIFSVFGTFPSWLSLAAGIELQRKECWASLPLSGPGDAHPFLWPPKHTFYSLCPQDELDPSVLVQ